MKRQKTPNDVLGRKMNCVNFSQCPMCYGCRNYNSKDPDCVECAKDAKNNLCNTQLHKGDLIANMISKNTIKIDKPVEFESEPR